MRVSCDTIQEKGKEEEGGGDEKESWEEDRETERAHRWAALGGLMTSARRLLGPQECRAQPANGLQGSAGPCKSGPQKSPVVRWTPVGAGKRWMGTGDAQAHKPCRAATVRKPGRARFTHHWDTHNSLAPTLPPTACTHTSGSSPWIAQWKSPGFFRLRYRRRVFQINRTWEAVPAQYLRQWRTGRHACKAKERHRLESLLSVGGHSLLGHHGIMGERWRSLTWADRSRGADRHKLPASSHGSYYITVLSRAPLPLRSANRCGRLPAMATFGAVCCCWWRARGRSSRGGGRIPAINLAPAGLAGLLGWRRRL